MANNYDFLRTFTFDGKETNHLFQIAKVTIPFLSKENEFYTVGNTDGKKFRGTRLGEHSIQIDGFVIKDNTGKSVSESMDELKLLINSDEPKQLIFDIFPDRYFNAIFSGAQEYDATNLEYTPLSLVFDVPDALAHSVEPTGFSNVYTDGTNLVLDSEFNNIPKYMVPWVKKLDEKFEGSNIARADLSNGTYVGAGEGNYYWLYKTWVSNRTLPTLRKGSQIGVSIYVRINNVVEGNESSGALALEEFTNGKKNGTTHFIPFPNKVNDEFVKYSGTFTLTNETTNGIAMSLGMYGETSSIDFSKPMMALLPPLGTKVVEPIVGATLHSNSLDFGDYDYSGNPNLSAKLNASSFSSGTGATVADDGDEIVFTLDGSNQLAKYSTRTQTPLVEGKQYTISCEIMLEDGFTGNPSGIRLQHAYLPGGNLVLETSTVPKNELNTWQTLTGTKTVKYTSDVPIIWYPLFRDIRNLKPTGKVRLRNIKIEEGSTATPYQPNLLDAPYYLSKVELGENIADPTVIFPIKTSAYRLYGVNMLEEFKVGQKYTITIKGTKSETQEFRVYNSGDILLGTMKPVEGLFDVWTLSFTPTLVSSSTPRLLAIYQTPQSTAGACQIDWLKIEKGDTRTPNIPYYKYRGLHSYPSNNPNDYAWEYDPSYFNAINYVASEEGYSDVIRIKNKGTYKVYPTFNFTMNGENGLVGLISENGSILQFGNPEDVDGTTSTRVEQGLEQTFWGNTMSPDVTVNAPFSSVYPYLDWKPEKPNLVQGTWVMDKNVDTAIAGFQYSPTTEVWHGPSLMMDIDAPSNGDRTIPVSHHYRFIFDNTSKTQRGRMEFSTFDEEGKPLMTTIVRDSTITSNELIVEYFWKGQKINGVSLNRRTFQKSFFEVNMDRVGDKLLYRFVQIKQLTTVPGGFSGVTIDNEYKFTWNLDQPDTSKFVKSGVWAMRFGETHHVLMEVTDVQTRWEGTPYYIDMKNYFKDGDNVQIDTKNRELLINGTVNNNLNIVGNQWEYFMVNPGESTFQPVYSSWANIPTVTAELRERYL